jgi:hypothetical protein
LPVVETAHADNFLQRVTVDIFDSALADDGLAAIDALDTEVRGVRDRDETDFRRPAWRSQSHGDGIERSAGAVEVWLVRQRRSSNARDTSERPRVNVGTRKLPTVVARVGDVAARDER